MVFSNSFIVSSKGINLISIELLYVQGKMRHMRYKNIRTFARMKYHDSGNVLFDLV